MVNYLFFANFEKKIYVFAFIFYVKKVILGNQGNSNIMSNIYSSLDYNYN